MSGGLLLIGVVLILGAIALWYWRVLEDPAEIDTEESSYLDDTDTEDALRVQIRQSPQTEQQAEREYK